MSNKIQVVKDLKEKSILVRKELNAPIENVWRAYTESELLDQWWGPAPWRAETKSMDFKVGGSWLYAMVSPENQRHWGRMEYKAIKQHESFDVEDCFCDENGNPNPALPTSRGRISFAKTPGGTLVEFKMTYNKESDVQAIIDMGFEQGITICMEQLDGLLVKENV